MSDTSIGAARPSRLEFAGFWRRIGAAFIDMLILAIVGWLGSTAFYDQLVQWGPSAAIIGLPVTLLYFGVLNSGLAGGGTPGKRATGIAVIGRDGQEISLLRSLWRAAVYLVPLYAGYDLSFAPLSPAQRIVAEVLQAVLVFGVVLSTVYLYLANWRTRQVMHDLAAGTYVVRRWSNPPPVDVHVNRLHLVVVAILLLLSAAALPLAERFDIQTPFGRALGVDFDRLLDIQRAASDEPDLLSSAVTAETTTWYTNGAATTSTDLNVLVLHRGATNDPQGIAKRVAARVLQTDPTIMGEQKLTVIVRYGFSIGIWGNWQSYGYSYTPAEWKALIAGRPAN